MSMTGSRSYGLLPFSLIWFLPFLSDFKAKIYYQLVADGSVRGRWACHSGMKNEEYDNM